MNPFDVRQEVARQYTEGLAKGREESAGRIAELERERYELLEWKRSAMEILGDWEKVRVALSEPGLLGDSKAKACEVRAMQLREAIRVLADALERSQCRCLFGVPDPRKVPASLPLVECDRCATLYNHSAVKEVLE